VCQLKTLTEQLEDDSGQDNKNSLPHEYGKKDWMEQIASVGEKQKN
jgi:hypothetical protein